MKYAGVRGVAFVDADTLVYTRRRDGDSRGLSFRLESSSDLRSWAVEDFEDFEETVTELPQSEVEEVAVHLPLRDSGRRYWRVRVAILPGN